MKKTLFLFLLILTSFISFGQNSDEVKKVNVLFNNGIRAFIPVGNLKQTHHFGVGASAEAELLPSKEKMGYFVSTGYNYILGTEANQSLFQLPILVGLRYHIDSTISIGQSVGTSFFNEAVGFRTTFASSLRFNISRLSVEAEYITALRPGHSNDLSGLSFRLGYNLK